MPTIKELKSQHPDIYTVIKSVQGKDWLSKLIKMVNQQKHQEEVRLGTDAVRVGPLDGPSVMKIGVNQGVTFVRMCCLLWPRTRSSHLLMELSTGRNGRRPWIRWRA